MGKNGDLRDSQGTFITWQCDRLAAADTSWHDTARTGSRLCPLPSAVEVGGDTMIAAVKKRNKKDAPHKRAPRKKNDDQHSVFFNGRSSGGGKGA